MKINKILSILIVVSMLLLSFSGCGRKVEKKVLLQDGSTGEKIVEESKSFSDYSKLYYGNQIDALIQLYANNCDLAVIDYFTALNYIGKDNDFPLFDIDDSFSFPNDEYAVGFRNGSDAVNYVNKAISEMFNDGSLKQIAEKYNLSDSLLSKATFDDVKSSGTESDWEYIKNKGTLVVGITLFAPINYYNEEGTLIGFDTEFATTVSKKLGLNVKFEVIEWEEADEMLNNKAIDCVWNTVAVTEERMEYMDFSISYLQGKQVAVINTMPASDLTN